MGNVDIEGIEERAEGILAQVPDWIWDGERLPVPVDHIADSVFSLLIREVEDMGAAPGSPELEPGQSISGLLLPSRSEIWVNADEARQWPGRKRFTICHELGHWVLHQRGQQALFCRRTSVEEAPADTRPPLPVTEEEANAFAAAFLMPADLIRRHYDNCDGDFDALRKRFHASGAAMGRRLHAVI